MECHDCGREISPLSRTKLCDDCYIEGRQHTGNFTGTTSVDPAFDEVDVSDFKNRNLE